MSELNAHVGSRIRSYRRQRRMTLQQLADIIHKSRASVSKYETGEITLDIETLYDISRALDVSVYQLTDYQPATEEIPSRSAGLIQHSPFFQADQLYFYFYDGRYHRLKDGIIHIHKTEDPAGSCEASMFISSIASSGRSSGVHYTGKVVYSDMLIRFSFVNRYNPLEEDLLYIFNPLELREDTEGLLCGISSVDLMPCAFKCLVTLKPQEATEELKKRVLFSSQELRRLQKLNMLLVNNRE